MQTIRCFVAVEIPEDVQALLSPVQASLRSAVRAAGGGRASWTRLGNFHLTLQFLGDVRSDAIDEIGEALQAVAATQRPFSMAIGGIGAFPNLNRPRVLWVGIKQGAAAVTRLAEAVNAQLARIGYPAEGRFHPHLTLARLRNRINLGPQVHLFSKYDTIDTATVNVNEIVLMRSQLHPKGAVYTPLKMCRFSR